MLAQTGRKPPIRGARPPARPFRRPLARQMLCPHCDDVMLARSRPDLIATLAPAPHAAAREGGALPLGFSRPGGKPWARLWTKDRGSPVTEADMAVDGFLK